MKILPKAVSKVIESFERLPGIGPKTAQRLAFYLLHVPQSQLDQFSESVRAIKKLTKLCSTCKNVSERETCGICESAQRDKSVICVVERPTDLLSLENTGKYSGMYHVLHGSIDPLNNIGPDEIFIAQLLTRVKNLGVDLEEIILATNPNMEGEATAMYITKELKKIIQNVTITRLAHGLPVGADVEYADELTLSRALEGRREF